MEFQRVRQNWTTLTFIYALEFYIYLYSIGNMQSSYYCCCCSVAIFCPTLCDPLDCSMQHFSLLHCFPNFAQIHVYWVGNAIYLSQPLCPLHLLPSVFPSIRVFSMSWLFAPGSQSIGASASAPLLPKNIQGWFILELTGLISLLSKELSGVIFSTTIQTHQFFCSQPSLWSSSYSHTWLQEKP